MKFTKQTAVAAGKKTSEVKRQAAVSNGKKGGRPITSPRTLEKLRRKAEAEVLEARRDTEFTVRWKAWKVEHPDVRDGDDEMMVAFSRIRSEIWDVGL